MDLTAQIIALLFLNFLIFYYVKTPRLPLLSQKCFTVMFILAIVNLAFDFLTNFTIANPDNISETVNRFCHDGFLGSLSTLVFIFAIYTILVARNQVRLGRRAVCIFSIPYVISILFILFGRIEYYRSENANYSYGQAVQVFFAEAVIYLIFVNILAEVKHKAFNREMRSAIHIGTFIWVGSLLVQYYFPEMLLSSVGIAMMMLYIFITFENPLERYDRKTGEFTRNALVEMLKESFARGKSFEVVEIVLMDYAGLMSGYGYDAGVAYHKAVAQRLHEITGCSVFGRHSDTMVIIWETDRPMLHGSFEEIKKKIDRPVAYEDRKLGVRSRMNVISCPSIGKDMDTVSKILDYMLRENENSNSEITVAEAGTLEAQKRAAGVEELVAKAVANDGLNVMMQPIYNTKTGRIMAAEALVRLKDCGGFGFISPEEFISIAERKGYISELGDEVLRKTARFYVENKLDVLGIDYIEVNLSGIQSSDKNLSSRLLNILGEEGLSPEKIDFEVTETASIECGSTLRTNMNRLREAGSSFAMDDFGTGYSNFSEMAEIRYDIVKLDKSLIWPCFDGDNRERSRDVLTNAINMIHATGSRIVAEGIETKEQKDAIIEWGVEYIQGYYFSKPIEGDKFIEFVKKFNEQ
ncbi:MAG: EAL domain-containing protein [Clostridiales bacterium]|jgi:EAL domain-containing protein (putative c-di-GMP-specific phosphodiesterase class I)/GGDEF domain-containing protein|nr:EAL domain-containing protein [Clostridiales bacterium]